jgi:hypothetical protein
MTETSTESPKQNHISEKAARIEKLLNSKTLKLHGDAYKGKYELNANNAEKYLQQTLQGRAIFNNDTQKYFKFGKEGRKKVTSHSRSSDIHLKLLAHIPSLIEHAVYIDTKPPYKEKSKYDTYDYFVIGVAIDGKEYTVKITIGQNSNGEWIYDQHVTEAKIKDLTVDRIGIPADKPLTSESELYPISNIKDTMLLEILQEKSSKIIDENSTSKPVNERGTR